MYSKKHNRISKIVNRDTAILMFLTMTLLPITIAVNSTTVNIMHSILDASFGNTTTVTEPAQTPIVLPLAIIITIFIGLRWAYISYKKEEFKTKFKTPVAQIVPVDMIDDKSWIHISNALLNSQNIFEHVQDYGDELEDTIKSIKTLPSMLFKLPAIKQYALKFKYNDEQNREYQMDFENSLLWIEKLTESPLLDRITVLSQLNSSDEQKAFADRTDEELITFFKPLAEFATYVEETQSKHELRIQEIKNLQRDLYDNTVRAKADELFNAGMKNISKLPNQQEE